MCGELLWRAIIWSYARLWESSCECDGRVSRKGAALSALEQKGWVWLFHGHAMLTFEASGVHIACIDRASGESDYTVLQDLEQDLHWDVYLFLGMS